MSVSIESGMLSMLLMKREVIPMREENNDLMVLEEGVEVGVVQACCTTGPAKL